MFVAHVAVTLLGGDAWAVETDEPVTAARRSNVELVITGQDADARLLEEAILELVARKDLTVVHDRDGVPSASVLARVAIDLESKEEVRVLVSRGRAGVPLVVRSIKRSDNPAVVREAVAQTVRAAVDASMLAEESRVVSAPTVPPPPPSVSAVAELPPPPVASIVPIPTLSPTSDVVDRGAPATHATSSSPWAVALSTFVAGGPYTEDSGPVVRAGVGVSFGSRRGLGPSIGLSAAYAVPFRVKTDVLTSHANLGFVRLMPAITVARFSRVALELALGGGIDVLTVDASSSVLPAQAIEEESTRVNPVLASLFTVHVALVQSVSLTVAGSLDVELSSRRYVLDDRGSQTDVFVPWRVRPSLVLGFAFGVLGDPLFQPRTVAAR